MMAVDAKRLNEARAIGSAATLSRRAQALDYAAGGDGTARNWHVMLVAGGMDRAVNLALGDGDSGCAHAEIERWMPVITRERGGGSRRLVTYQQRFLPGYLFIRVRWSAEVWQGLATIEGVRGMLGGAERPRALPEFEFMTFRQRFENDPEFLRALRKVPAKGDLVRFLKDHMAGVEGVVLALLGGDRLRIDAPMFGTMVPVEARLADVTKIG